MQRVIALGGLALGCLVLLAFAWSPAEPPKVKAPTEPPRQVVRFEPAPPPRESLDDRAIADPLAFSYEGSEPVPGPHAHAQSPSPPAPRPAPLLVYSKAAQTAAVDPAIAPPPARNPPTELEAARQSSSIRRLQAQTLGERNFLILAGAVIPCLLTSAIDTNAPGHVGCMLPSDVLSDTGAVVLLEKGTRVLGEYRSAMARGQNRLFVVWTRAVTPSGVAIALASPGADALGRAGFAGDLDTRFWERFGGAAVLSFIDEGGSLVIDRRNGRLARLPSDAAAAALDGASQIGPALRAPLAAQVTIFVAHDLDFSGVYGLQRRSEDRGQ